MDILIDRKNLVSVIKELNGLQIVSKIKTKEVEDNDLLIQFLESIESIEEGSSKEKMLTATIIKYYNEMARVVENIDNQSVLEFTQNKITQEREKPEKEIQKIVDFVTAKEEIKTKTDGLVKITDIMGGAGPEAVRDIFKFKITSKAHKILKLLLAGKRESYIVRKDIADKAEVSETLKRVKEKNKGLVIAKEEIVDGKNRDGSFRYNFFGDAEFWESRK